MGISAADLTILIVLIAGGGYYIYTTYLQPKPQANAAAALLNGNALGSNSGDGRNFVGAMERQKKRICIFYGSQTGTAEDYATRLAKEAKARFGVSSLVADPDEYDFDNLDQVPEDACLFFVVATYGEGEPTDNAVALLEFLNNAVEDEDYTFSNGGRSLENLNYVIFGLGNRTYEHFCEMGTIIDDRLSKLGAKAVCPRGEGDDDKSMEEDYLAWKDPMWNSLQKQMGLVEGAGSDSPDFELSELDPESVTDKAKIYLGELSQRALTGSRGVFDAKNPYPAPLIKVKELFEDGDRSCIFAEFDIKDTGMRYQAGDHIGVWPLNPDVEVERALRVFGLSDKRDTVIDITSLDPALAKVPFPTPTTYEAVFRHYLDIGSVASRQLIGSFAKYAPTEEAKRFLEKAGSDKTFYSQEVGERCLKLAEALQFAVGDKWLEDPEKTKVTPYEIPFDRIISGISRLQPRYYSISSSPRLYPDSVHVTAVVLKYPSGKTEEVGARNVYGTATNYLLSLMLASQGGPGALENQPPLRGDTHVAPKYRIEGPRGKFQAENKLYKVPIHIRRSNFRLPTGPKIPVVMIGPGTGVAPFRGFIQERIALARKAIEKDGPDALKSWGTITLFFGCRRSNHDYLYRDEWAEAKKELGDRFEIFTAFSREPGQPKIYVQKLLAEQRERVKKALVDSKGYAYICGDARHMAKDVEEILKDIVGGEQELKTMKERNRLHLDVWS